MAALTLAKHVAQYSVLRDDKTSVDTLAIAKLRSYADVPCWRHAEIGIRQSRSAS